MIEDHGCLRRLYIKLLIDISPRLHLGLISTLELDLLADMTV